MGGGKSTVIAWIWSRTVPSPDPAFGDIHVPIASSFLLSSKDGQEAWIEPIVDRSNKTVTYRIRKNGTKAELERAAEGTKVGRANFRCLLSDSAITAEYVKAQGQAGQIGETLMAVVTEIKGGRVFIAPDAIQSSTADALRDHPIAVECRETFLSGEVPAKLTGGTCHGYGLDRWGKLFTGRQLIALKTLSDLAHEVKVVIDADAKASGLIGEGTLLRNGGSGSVAYAEAIAVYLGFGS